MYCQNCGNAVADGAHFCGHCGAQAPAVTLTPPTRYGQDYPQPGNPPQSPQPHTFHHQSPPQTASPVKLQNQNQSGMIGGTSDDRFGCLTQVMLYATAFFGGGGAAETFKERHPAVGIPMMILAAALIAMWIVMWNIRAKARR
jgi:hypothetical protein